MSSTNARKHGLVVKLGCFTNRLQVRAGYQRPRDLNSIRRTKCMELTAMLTNSLKKQQNNIFDFPALLFMSLND